jgi:DNA-binding NtrC family response regulator
MSSKQGRTVLVVDDDGDMRDFCATALRLDGWQVHATGSADEAKELLKMVQFDVVLSDHATTSEAQGLARLIKFISPETEVVVMTGLPSLETALSCFAEGAHDYLVKPFHLETLLTAVNECVSPSSRKHKADPRETVWLKEVMKLFITAARAQRELPRLPAVLVVDDSLSHLLFRVAKEARAELAAAA